MNEFEVFVEAAEKEPEELAAYLSEACAGQPHMRERIHALLAAHRGAGFLDALTDNTPWQTPKIQGYKLLEQIGEGAFGNVYMAEQVVPMRRRVAVKVVKLGMDTKQVVARFDAERQAMAMMDHPSIASVYDAGTTDSGRPYFAMELVRGESITEFCDRQRFGTRRRLELIVDVCRAIQHAHQKGIIHRDIKPNNVMVTNHDGKALPKVIDFGIAKATEEPLTEKTLFTQFRQMVGTPAYMSPEQAEMNASDIDTRSDIYSVGVLMYELLTSKPPLELKQSSYEEILREIRETEPPTLAARISSLNEVERSTVADKRRVAPPELVRTVKGELNWIVSKALSKDRSRRYETAAALADDIERYLNNQPVLASPPSTTYRFLKFVKRNRLFVTSAASILAALVLGLALAISGQQAAKAQALVADRERQKAIEQAEVAREQRENAVAQSVRAKKTFEMLRDLLLAADPAQGYGANYTLREAVDEFVKTFPTRFDGSMPDVEAEINSIVGNTYNRLTFRYDAESYLKHAVELRKAIAPLDHAKLAAAYADLAVNALSRCRAAEARAAASHALASYKSAGIVAPEEVDEILKQSSAILDLGRLVEERTAEFRHHEVLSQVESVMLDSPESVTGTFINRAIFYFLDLGEYEKAIRVCKLQPSELNVKYSVQERNVRAILNSMLMFIYREHGERKLADQVAITLRADADGDEAWFRNNSWQKAILAQAILQDSGSSHEDKERALQLSAEFADRVFTAPERVQPDILACACHIYSLALVQHGQFEKAEDALHIGLARVPKHFPFLRGILERQLADVLARQGNLERAESVLRDAVQWRKVCLPEDYVQNSVAEMNLALFLHRLDAEGSRQEVLDKLKSARDRLSELPSGNYYRAAVDDALGQVREK